MEGYYALIFAIAGQVSDFTIRYPTVEDAVNYFYEKQSRIWKEEMNKSSIEKVELEVYQYSLF